MVVSEYLSHPGDCRVCRSEGTMHARAVQEGRTLGGSAPARDHARSLKGTPEFEQSSNERKNVEMRFAHLKVHHGFERMRLARAHRRAQRVPPRGYRAEPEDPCQSYLATAAGQASCCVCRVKARCRKPYPRWPQEAQQLPLRGAAASNRGQNQTFKAPYSEPHPSHLPAFSTASTRSSHGHCPARHHAGNAQPWAYLSARRGP